MQLGEILKTASQHDASDIHIISGHPPMMRVHTVMTPMDCPILTPEAVEIALKEMTNTEQREVFEKQKDLTSHTILKDSGDIVLTHTVNEARLACHCVLSRKTFRHWKI